MNDNDITEKYFIPEVVLLEKLKPHPRNYREHPEDQLIHLMESISQNGLYRNIVVAKDFTILAGHGVAKACNQLNMKEVTVVKLDIESDSPEALKILAGDNEVTHLGFIDDRALSEILREIKESSLNGLIGTGYDEQMLASLIMVTRPASEIKSMKEASAWAGLPEYDEEGEQYKVVVNFDSEKDREELINQLKIEHLKKLGKVWSFRWPNRPNDDPGSILFEG